MPNDREINVTEIKNGLYRIGSRLGPRFVYQYVLVDLYGAMLIDAGMRETPDEAIIPSLTEIGVKSEDLKWLVISHSDVDHYSGTNRMRDFAKSLKVLAHREDAPYIESKSKIEKARYFYYESFGVEHDAGTKQWFIDSIEPARVDMLLSGGESIKLGPNRVIDLIHTPGHSAGHVTVYDRSNQAAIVIDAILWKGLFDTEQNVISPPPYYHLPEYVSSIDRVLNLPFDTLLTGHYDVMKGKAAHTFLHESKQYVEQLEQVIQRHIDEADQPLSLRQILERTNETIGPYTEMMVELTGPIYAHLLDLEQKQKVFRTYENKIAHWFN